MLHRNLLVAALALAPAVAVVSGCGPKQTVQQGAVAAPARPAPAPAPALDPARLDPLSEPVIWDTVQQLNQACAEGLARAEAVKKQLLALQGQHTLDNTLVPFNALLIHLDRVLPTSELVANTHPDKAMRTAAEECSKQAQKFFSELKLNRALFDALNGVAEDGLDEKALRFRKLMLRDYRRAGVDRDEATRKLLGELQEKMVNLGQTFQRNLRESKLAMEVAEKDLAGMPADWLAGKKKAAGPDGKISVTTDYPDFFPVESYAKNEAVRRELYKLYLTRAFPGNDQVLKDLLQARHTYASMLGYSDWAAYNAEDKMVRTRDVIAQFIDKVADLARPRMQADLKQILARKKKDDRKARLVGAWDRFYYVNKIQAEQYGVNPEEVRAYFDVTRVKQGLLAMAQELFGLTFRRVEGAKVWHASVEAYDVLLGEEKIGRFYLDLHPRDGKYGHAAEFPMISGVTGVQLPAASLVCNFPDPAKAAGGPALMEHDQVTTFFHEFGHLMHQLLAGRQRWATLAGIACEWDFVEAPSQLLEEWAWDAGVLARFAVHHKTGAAIPEKLVARMNKARSFGKGVHVMRQMFFAALSFAYHAKDPATFDLKDELLAVLQKYSPYPYQEGTAVFANFGHLEGYSSAYYTYMWSLVLARDLLTRFQEKGLMNQEVAAAYRRGILEPGGAVDAAQMVKDFLGRDYTFDAYAAWLKE